MERSRNFRGFFLFPDKMKVDAPFAVGSDTLLNPDYGKRQRRRQELARLADNDVALERFLIAPDL
jgi:hypothetical protein